MKVLAVSDLHHDARTLGISRREEVERAVMRAVDLAKQMIVGLFVFTGDLCDPDDAGDVLRASAFAIRVAGELADAGIGSAWIAGNHDVKEDGLGTTTIGPLAEAARHGRMRDLVHVFEQPRYVELDGPENWPHVAILALPFTASTRPKADGDKSIYLQPDVFVRMLGNTLAPPPRTMPLLVLSHLMLEGAKMSEESREMARGRDIAFPREEVAQLSRRFARTGIIQGHYHQPQEIEVAPGLVAHVPGSVARLNFGERRNTPSFLLLEV